MTCVAHLDVVRDQFTKQAAAFSSAVHANDPEAMELYVRSIAPRQGDWILDVASGPGLVAKALSPQCENICCVDVTTEMLQRAKALVPCLRAFEADVLSLPVRSGAFDKSISRLAFHHVTEPGTVLREMVRATKSGGKIVVNDIVTSEDPNESEYTEKIERLRDPSHSRMLSTSKLTRIIDEADLEILEVMSYRIPLDHEEWMGRVFPPEENRPKVRAMLEKIAGRDMGGMRVYFEDGRLMISREARIFSARKK